MPKGAKNWVEFWVGFTESVVFCASLGTGREPIGSIKKVLRICATPFFIVVLLCGNNSGTPPLSKE